MKVLLTTLNATYTHSCLALRCLAASAPRHKAHLVIKEFTINNNADDILATIFKAQPSVVCFSCYIWNITLTLALVDNLKKVLPNAKVILGGPEVSFNAAAVLAQCAADVVVSGEGEAVFASLMVFFIDGEGALATIPNITYRDKQGECVETAKTSVLLDLNDLPFLYETGLGGLANKAIYYESSRGCPFRCAYCLSGADNQVRFLDLNRCFAELQFFLDQSPKRVKFLDRTFNCKKSHAMAIWRYLIDHDNGVTNFHFEMAADLLDTDMLALLAQARPGLFQFEIGIQSTHKPTLEAIGRQTDLQACFRHIRAIRDAGNVHLHVDLIAALPLEGIEAFRESFNAVYALSANKVQLGFLKLLHGSALRAKADDYGLVYRQKAPYEVLFTPDLSFADVIRLKELEEMLENYYNTKRLKWTLAFAVPLFESPFHFYDALAKAKNHESPQSKARLYEDLYDFLCAQGVAEQVIIGNLLAFDMLLKDRGVNPPNWLGTDMTESDKQAAKRFIRRFPGNESGKLNRWLHIQKFAYDIVPWVLGQTIEIMKRDNFILFDYTGKACVFRTMEDSEWNVV